MKQVLPINRFYGGRAPGDRTGPLGSFKEGIRLDIFSNVDQVSILPATAKVSGSIVTDLIKWIVPVGSKIYYYGDTGRFYSSDLDGTNWSLIGTLTNSSGNGMSYYEEDDYLYLTKDSTLARYGPIGGSPVLYDEFLESEGGDPTNTHVLDLELSSSQYAYVADNADLSITGDFTLEAWVKLEQLPSTAGSTFEIIAKYGDTAGKRSYGLGIPTTDKLNVVYSGDGSAITSITTDSAFFTNDDVGVWVHLAVAVDVSAKTASFYKNGSLVTSTSTGTQTSVHDNASNFSIGAMYENGTVTNYFDGLIDDVRVWSDIRTQTEIQLNKGVELAGTEANLAGYWKFNNDATDSAKSSDLTLSGSPVYSTDVPFSGATARVDIDQSNSAAGQTYTLPTAIDEGATHQQSFTPGKDPQKSIEVNIDTIGTGTWTLTVHDSLDREIASKSVSNEDLNTGDFEFTFASAWRPRIGATYHFHLTSTVADGIVVTGTADDLEDADFTSYFGFLVTDTDYHPIAISPVGDLIVGNGSWLAKWDGITYTANEIEFPRGLKIRTLTHAKEFLTGGVWRGDSVTDNDEGWFFFWDGTASAYNFGSELGFGGVNAATVISGKTFLVAGSTSVVYEAQGVEDPTPLFKIPDIGDGKYVEIYPGALDIWDGFLCIGVAGGGNSSSVLRGVWLYGTKYREYLPALNYAFTISNNSDEQSTDVAIGAVKGIGRRLFIGWKDGSDYGVDMVEADGSPASSAEYGSLIFDDNRVFKKKKGLTLVANHEALSGNGEGVQLRYRLDRASSWTTGTVNTASDSVITKLPIVLTDRWYEFEIGFVLSSSGSSKPKLTAISFEYDDMREEKAIGG